MSKFTYLFSRIISLDYRSMWDSAGKVKKKSHKGRIRVLFDMIQCGFKYQAGYNDYLEFEFYLLDKNQRKTYLTRGINNAIIRNFNKEKSRKFLDDKVQFNQKFAPLLNRSFLSLEKCSFEEFKKFLKNKNQIIVKPIFGEGGVGIEIINLTQCKDLKQLYESLIEKNQLLIEEVIIQHEQMNLLYKKSVNTIRFFTFLKKGQVTVLQAILKIGNGGVVDNFSSGGMYTFLDEKGCVLVPAIDKLDHIFSHHPVTNTPIVGFTVPFYQEATELVSKASLKMKDCQYIGWDVAISSKGPVIIEGNGFPGVFQIKPSLSKDKIGIYPKYQEVMHISKK